MLKSKKLKRVFSIIMTSVFCMVAFSQTMHADKYALNGTIDSALTIMDSKTGWSSSVDTGQIDIDLQSDSNDGAIFTAYKLLDIDNVNGMLEVKIPDKAQPFWNSYTGKTSGVDATVKDIKNKIKTEGDAAGQSSAIIGKFLTFMGTNPTEIPDGTPSTSATEGKAQITTDFGFYAILQTGAPVNGFIASAPVLACLPMQDPDDDTTWLSKFTIVPKDDKISVEKKVHASDEGTFEDETITNIGDRVTYEIIAKLPKYGTDIVNDGITYSLVDTLPNGVTINPSSLKAQLSNDDGASYTDADTGIVNPQYDGTSTITASITDYGANINNQYDHIKITYEAVLNENAVIEAETNVNGNMNTVTLKYSAYKGELNPAEATADAKVYTMGLDIQKVGEDGTTALAGAEFEVYKNSDGTGLIQFVEAIGVDGIQRYRVATPDEIANDAVTKVTTITVTENGANKGKLMLDGLNDTTYYIKETKAPTGYNLPENLVPVEVKPDDTSDYKAGSTELQFDQNRLNKVIKNTTGIDLPVTGGIGTIIFTVIGLLLMAGAAYFLFFSRKRNAK
ncbi:MAG: SpaH/EbpB family LPXTG-anchored major pilin [Clostridiales bacterium]|nr:SpaH/EbpB family LPXTG-anchored major pilin [Clostridiales bacterium]